MKRWVFLVLILAFWSSVASGDDLKIGYAEFVPFTYTDSNNKAAGIFIDLGREVYRKLNITSVSETAFPAARLMKTIERGEIDIWYGIKRPPMAKYSIFGTELLGTVEMNLYSMKKVAEVTKKEDLSGKSVILILGYGYSDWGPYIRNRENKIKYYQVKTHEKALQTLKRGNFDYLLNYTYPVKNALEKLSVPGLVKKQISVLDCYFILSKQTPDGEALLKRLDTALREIKQSR